MKFILILSVFLYTTPVFAQAYLDSHSKQRDSVIQALKNQLDLDSFMAQDSVLLSNIGKPYVDFTATSLDNKRITEKQLIGKVTLLNFWFEGCSPCIAEIDDFNELYLKHKDNPDFQFISFTKDEAERAENAKLKYNILYPICPVSWDECYRLIFNGGFPTIIITGKDGKIIYIESGGSTKKEVVKKQVQLFEQKIVEALSL
jgi:thiol-disulfide isomerase/thioredoxin